MACEEQETTYWAGITRLDKGSCPPPSSLQGGLALHMPTPLAPGYTPFERPFCVLPHPGPARAVSHPWLLLCPYPHWS